MPALYRGLIGIWRCWFLWREKSENQPQTQPTYGTQPDPTWATFVGGERFQHCAIPGRHRHSGPVAVSK